MVLLPGTRKTDKQGVERKGVMTNVPLMLVIYAVYICVVFLTKTFYNFETVLIILNKLNFVPTLILINCNYC